MIFLEPALILFCIFVVVVMAVLWYRIYRKRNPIAVHQPRERIDGWHLRIELVSRDRSYYNIEYRELWKVYNWYLTKDSPKYNVLYKDGMRIICRENITGMYLEKVRLIKENFVQADNDDY